jgi:hypothetical protein
LKNLEVDGRILGWNFGKEGGICGLDASGSGQRPVAGPCGKSDELASSINGGEFLD